MNLAREMKMTMEHGYNYTNDQLVLLVQSQILKGLGELDVGGRVETIQSSNFLRTARILTSVMETCGPCCHSNFRERPSAHADVKKNIKD